ncbi:MAG: hypothetical protein V4710_06835 [Verrucomicrobiota bacterium]
MRIRLPILLGLAGLAGYLAWQRPGTGSGPVPGTLPDMAPVGLPLPPSPIARQSTPPPEEPVPELSVPDLQLAPRLDLQRGSLPWEERMERITRSTALSEAAKAHELLRILKTLPEEGLDLATHEAISRLPDKDYTAALGLLIDPQTHGRILAVLFADLLERPDPITLPALLSIARISNHPFAAQASDNLGLLLGKHFGTNWLRWESEIRQAMRQPGTL